MAFGEIGLTPYEYYCLTPYEFSCVVHGWEMKQAKESALLRRQTQILYAGWGGKEDLTRYWPIELLDGHGVKKMTKRKMRGIMGKAWKREIERRLSNGRNSKS